MNLADEYAWNCSYKIAVSLYNKIPNDQKVVLEIGDLRSDLYEHFLLKKNKYDSQRGDYKQFINLVLSTGAKILLLKFYDNTQKNYAYYQLRTDNKQLGYESYEGELLYVEIDNNGPEQNLEYEESTMRLVEVAIREIETLCYQFEVKYDAKNPLGCLLNVLDKTLNDWSDDEFFGIRELTRKRLVELGVAVKERCIALRKSNGKLRSRGVRKAVREIMTKLGDITLEKLKLELDKRNIFYTENAAIVNYYAIKKELGFANTKSKATVANLVRELFDEGKGITDLSELVCEVRKRKRWDVLNSTVARELAILEKKRKESLRKSVNN